MSTLSSGSNTRIGWGVVADNLLVRSERNPQGYTVEDLRAALNTYALLYPTVAVPDSWLATNSLLQTILSSGDGTELLQGGVVTVALRDSFDTVGDFFATRTPQNLHGFCATPQFAQIVDSCATSVLRFPISEVGAAYQQMASEVLSEDVLRRLGVSEPSVEIVRREVALHPEATSNNTFVKDEVCPLLPEEDAELVMNAVRAPYHINLPNLLGTGIVAHAGFSGDRVLAALRGQSVERGMIEVVSGVTPNSPFVATFEDPLVLWLLDVVGTMTAAELNAARGSSEFSQQFAALQHYLNQKDMVEAQVAWYQYERLLERYLRDAAEAVWRMRQSVVGEGDGVVIVQGGTSVRIHAPNQGVQLTGLTEHTSSATNMDTLQVVGRRIHMPVMEERVT